MPGGFVHIFQRTLRTLLRTPLRTTLRTQVRGARCGEPGAVSHVASDGALSQRALSQRRGRNGSRKGVRKCVDEGVRGSACF